MNTEEIKQAFQQAASFFQAQQYEQALQLLEQLDNAAPNTRDVLYFKARVLGVLNRPQESAALCDRLTALGDARGEQLKAALAVAPAGPPPLPSTEDAGSAGPPPLLPDQDMLPSYATPPTYGPARRNLNTRNLVGFGLMGALLLAAVLVVIVRGGNRDQAGLEPAMPPSPVEQLASEIGEEMPSPEIPPPPAESSVEASAAPDLTPVEQSPESLAADPDDAPPPEETQDETPAAEPPPPPPAGSEPVELLAAQLQEMDSVEQLKTLSEMETAQLAEMMEAQSKAVVRVLAEEASTLEEQDAVTQLRERLENTDFQEAARVMKEVLAQADPPAFPGVNLSTFDETLKPKPSYIDEVLRDFELNKKDDAAQQEPRVLPADEEDAKIIPVEKAAEQASPKAEKPAPEEPVRPIFGTALAKTLEFPDDESLGEISLRKTGALEREPWERAAEARGKLGIPPGYDVKLQMQTRRLEHLEALKADDIQILSLWSLKIDDKRLEPVKRLTGLQELDIRQTNVTIDGWEELRKALPSCRILF